jgi:CHASE2 domain-containing sensor protein
LAGGYRSSEFVGYDVLLNYRASRVIARQIPLSAILNGSMDGELPDLIPDRIVLIGTIARSFKDYAQTPYGELAGVEIQAHMVSQLLSWTMDGRPMLQCWTPWGDGMWIVGWATVGGMFALRLRSTVRLVLLGVGLAGCLFLACFVLLLQGVWAPLMPPLLAMLASSGIIWLQKQNA